MGDISRHRDIYLNTRGAIPQRLLDKCKIAPADLTYLELGNYLTDVSQFRDPVSYIFAKRKIWQEKILPKAENAKELIQALVLLAGATTGALLSPAGRPKNAVLAGGIGALPLLLVTNDLLAGIVDIDDWIDRMLGNPIDRVKGGRRTDAEYGYVGRFFQHFIEGITHLIFAQEATRRLPGQWAQIEPIPEENVSAVFKESFTQYYPHEHTDQPPYVWDASKRHRYPKWYGVSRRQRTLESERGVMNVVDKDYVQYLAEGLSTLETEWRTFKPADTEKRRKALVRLGKILHGVEDWFFHSNVVELIRLRGFTRRDGETDEVFVQRFVREELKKERSFNAATPEERVRQQRHLYRRLRFPLYEPGTWENSTGIANKKSSTLSLDLAYPAFPSQQDTAHTLLGALENLEGKLHGGTPNLSAIPPWLTCIGNKFVHGTAEGRKLFREKAEARGIRVPASARNTAELQQFAQTVSQDKAKAALIDVLREWLPLIVTLLDASERQRLVANVAPLLWTNQAEAGSLPKGSPKFEEEEQLARHKRALQPRLHEDGVTESNYRRAIRFLADCDYLGPHGRAALEKGFETDRESETLNEWAPGAGGFLMQFALQMQEAMDTSDEVTKRLNEYGSLYDPATDNGAFEEIVGSHSLMSKDTVDSLPFFDDATVLASVASQSVLHILLEEVSSPPGDSGLDWQQILRHFIRYPVASGGWERRAMIFFHEKLEQLARGVAGTEKDAIPKFADLPELARLAQAARIPRTVLEQERLARQKGGTKAAELEDEYIKLETQVSSYRRPFA